MDELSGIITAGVPEQDDCPILTRTKAFIVDQGTTVTLEHIFRNKSGNPVSLTALFGAGGDSFSNEEWLGKLHLRVKECLGRGSSSTSNPIWAVDMIYPHDPANGVVRAELDSKINARSGVYLLSWGVESDQGKIVLVNNTYMSVERTLFADISTLEEGLGPLTIQDVRTLLRDSGANENIRLDDVEWADDQVVAAIMRPVEHWNEVPPPIEQFTTRDFPYRYNWSNGTIAQLYFMAANWYRRNKQQIQAGGMSDDDLNRDQAYDAKANQLWKEYTEWVSVKKLELNMRKVNGSVQSIYGSGHRVY